MPDPIASYKDLCIDAVDIREAGRFWSPVLGLKLSGRKMISLTGPTALHRIWINEVPEARTVKNRVHLDVHAGALADLEAIGARVLEPATAERHWSVLADPDGQEFCAFVRDEVPDYRLYELAVDCADPERLAHWWAELYGVPAKQDGDCWYHEVPDAPFESMVYAAVPEPKQLKNRVHWDIRADLQSLVERGATVLRPKGKGIRWTVMADPEGNEFCAFTPR